MPKKPSDQLARSTGPLSKIGGKGVREKLEQELEDAVDEVSWISSNGSGKSGIQPTIRMTSIFLY
jgi:hypothetical protein